MNLLNTNMLHTATVWNEKRQPEVNSEIIFCSHGTKEQFLIETNNFAEARTYYSRLLMKTDKNLELLTCPVCNKFLIRSNSESVKYV